MLEAQFFNFLFQRKCGFIMSDQYPLPKFSFKVTWNEAELTFSEVSGLDADTDVIEYRHGNSKQYNTIKMPGLQKFGDVTMKRGTFQGSNEFFEWWRSVQLNKIDRRSVTISLLNEEQKPVVTWKLKQAWAKKITPTDLKSDGSEVAIESIEVVHEGLEIEHQAAAAS